MLGNLIGGFITIIIGVNLIGPIADAVELTKTGSTAIDGTNITSGATATILGLTPLFFSLGILAAGVALAVGGLRNAGIM